MSGKSNTSDVVDFKNDDVPSNNEDECFRWEERPVKHCAPRPRKRLLAVSDVSDLGVKKSAANKQEEEGEKKDSMKT